MPVTHTHPPQAFPLLSTLFIHLLPTYMSMRYVKNDKDGKKIAQPKKSVEQSDKLNYIFRANTI